MKSPGPRVLVALGSSGPLRVLPAVLDVVRGLGGTVLLATSGRSPGTASTGTFVADLLPLEAALRHCDLLVTHGGSSGLYPALGEGTPVLAIPANIDTHLSSAILVKSGAGLAVRVEHATRPALRRAVQRLLADATFRKAASRCAGFIRAHDTRKIFPDLLRLWFAWQA